MLVVLQIASEGLKGRVFEVSLADLQKVCPTLFYFPARALCKRIVNSARRNACMHIEVCHSSDTAPQESCGKLVTYDLPLSSILPVPSRMQQCVLARLLCTLGLGLSKPQPSSCHIQEHSGLRYRMRITLSARCVSVWRRYKGTHA